MDWYNTFNAVEAALWVIVAGVIAGRVPCSSGPQRAAVVIAAIAFVVFGVTDVLEIGRAGQLPLWLWTLKIGCGVAILAARYLWRGWMTFRWRDREFLFGMGCLIAVGLVIALQQYLTRKSNPQIARISQIENMTPREKRWPSHESSMDSESASSAKSVDQTWKIANRVEWHPSRAECATTLPKMFAL